MKTVEKKLKELREQVIKADLAYEQNQPSLTDDKYDELYMELVELEKNNPQYFDENSPTNKLFTVTVEGLEKSEHKFPMLSQEKAKTKESLTGFFDKVEDNYYIVQEKLDGLTLVLTYNKGKLIKAVTRGNGYVGEDVTHTVKTFSNLPLTIPYTKELTIRAEAIITFKDFEKANTDGKYSNCRNLASGTVRQLDATVAKERNLKAIVFDLVDIEDKKFTTDLEQLNFLESLNFELAETKVFSKEQKTEMLSYILNYENNERKKLDHMIDGLVIKSTSLKLREELGYTSKHPKFTIAFKFKSLNATTKLKDIIVQVGKTGQLTPVAVFEEVTIDNVKISRASLHNYANIKDKDIRIGDTILVERANDVIPQVVKSFKELRESDLESVVEPEFCPCCKSKAEYDGENLYCTGEPEKCAEKMLGLLSHFVSKNALNVVGVSEKTIKELFEKGYIKNYQDLFNLNSRYDDLVALKGFGKTSVDKIISGMENAKKAPLNRFIYSLSIDLIGNSASKELVSRFGNMYEIYKLLENNQLETELLNLDKFGTKSVNSFISYLTNETSKERLNFFKEIGFEAFNSDLKVETKEQLGDSLNDKTFVITGKLSESRKFFEEKIESLGGKVSGSVSKNTDYVILGLDKLGSSKHKKAVQLGTTILSEDDFNNLINN